jgi:hydrogen cyanide synthase HcnB
MNTTRIVVIGAGPAGTRAALTLARAGLRPTLIDETPSNGGQIYRRRPQALGERGNPYGFEARKAARLHGDFDVARGAIDFRGDATVWDVKPGIVHAIEQNRAVAIGWDRLIIATGAMDRTIPFPGWTLPGVITLGGAQTLLKAQYSIAGPGVVLFGTGPLLYLVAYQYARAGAGVAAVLDTSPRARLSDAASAAIAGGAAFLKGLYYVSALAARGIRIWTGVTGFAVDGDGAVKRATWTDAQRVARSLPCAAVAAGFNLASQTQIADLCELRFAFNALQRQWLPVVDDAGRSANPAIYLAGDGAVIGGADVAELTGERAALALLADLQQGAPQRRIGRINRKLRRSARFRKTLDGRLFPFPEAMARTVDDDVMVCRCEGITAGEIRNSVETFGADELNRAKAFSRVGMGRCQGRVCGAAAAELIADAARCPIESVGRLRGQAPVKPVQLALIAGDAER